MKDGGERTLSEIIELAEKAMPDEENVRMRVRGSLQNLWVKNQVSRKRVRSHGRTNVYYKRTRAARRHG